MLRCTSDEVVGSLLTWYKTCVRFKCDTLQHIAMSSQEYCLFTKMTAIRLSQGGSRRGAGLSSCSFYYYEIKIQYLQQTCSVKICHG